MAANTNLNEALTAVGASALVQKRIDPVLLEYQRRYAPLCRAIPTTGWNSTVYYFNNRSQNPFGGFVTDGGARQVAVSTYNQNQYTIKNLQVVGAVTGYAQAVTQDLIGNLRATEMQGAARAFYWTVETALLWGNSASTVFGPYPQFDGADTIASVYSGDTQNAIDFGGNPFSLGALDQLIDLTENQVSEDVQNSGWMFVVSPTANSRLSQLFVNQQRFVDEVEVEAGLIVPSYRNVPLVKSSFLSPRTTQMGTVTSGTTTGGTLGAGDYYYQVSAIINAFGETLPCTEVHQHVSSGAGSINTLSFSPPTGFENGNVITYKVFRADTSGEESLLGYVDANVAIGSDGVTPLVTNQIVDNGTTLIAQNSTGPTQPLSVPAAYSVIGENADAVPLVAGAQSVYLISRDPNFIIRPYIREMKPVDVFPTTASPDSLPYAMVGDTTLAVRAPKYLSRLSNTIVTLSS